MIGAVRKIPGRLEPVQLGEVAALTDASWRQRAATNCRASNQWTAKSRDTMISFSTAFGDFTDEVGKREDHRGEDTWRQASAFICPL